jgi:hypothetical protein
LEEFEELDAATRRLLDEARHAIPRAIEDITERKKRKTNPITLRNGAICLRSPVNKKQSL